MASIVVSGDISGAVTLQAPAVAGTTTLTLPTTSGTIVTTAGATSLTTSGNLTFTGTGNRIIGDFSNALPTGVAFQTSVSNGATVLYAIPNGTGNQSNFILLNGSDITNFSRFNIRHNTTSSTLTNQIGGTGTYVPFTIETGGSERLRIDTSGNVGIGTSSPSQKLDVSGVVRYGNGSTSIGQLSFGSSLVTLEANSSNTSLGLYASGTGSMQLFTNAVERMRIDSSGNIFAPFNTQSTSLVVGGNGTTSSLGARVCIRSAISAGASLNYAININDSNTNTAGGLNLIGWSHNSEDYSAGNVRASLGATIDGGGAGSLVFRTGGFGSQAERMRIDSTGALGFSGANYGTSGQVLTSNGSGSAPSWQTASGNPTGTVLMWSTNSAPSGYVLCDGSAISRATFSALFAVIGTTYGAGDGSTTFNVPNFTNRMPVGSGGTYALASTGGSATTTLATTNLPAHNHTITISDPGHSHPNGGFNQLISSNCSGTATGFDDSCGEPNISRSGTITTNTTGITATSANTGSGTAFNTISPYLGIRFIIKT